MHQRLLVELPTVARYLLTQSGQLLSIKRFPWHLDYNLINEFHDWEVRVGIRTEFGTYEIGPIVAQIKSNGSYSRIQLSVMTGDTTSFHQFIATMEPSEVVCDELKKLWRQKQFEDPVKLAKIKVNVC